MIKETAVHYGDESMSYLFNDELNGQYNETIEFAKYDNPNKTKIYSREPYAQQLYNAYADYFGDLPDKISKDLVINGIYKVRARAINFEDKMLICDEFVSGTPVYVSFTEYNGNVQSFVDTNDTNEPFNVIITKHLNGAYFGSHKKHSHIQYYNELTEFASNGKWFDVCIIELIKGGFIALYRDTIRCFIPGSHAAANIIIDFDKYIGKTLPVVIDNFDYTSNLYIVSYKKYIRKSMHLRIHELEFGKKYTGRLTNNPSNFGLFVEIEEYFTGLIHKTEFMNYYQIASKYKVGDEIDFYIKNVTKKNGAYRIVLTLDERNIDENRRYWTKLKKNIVGKTLSYFYDNENDKFFIIDENGEHIPVHVEYDDIKTSLYKFKNLKIADINILNRDIKFDFC